MSDYQLSVCAEMVFLDLPFVDRVKRIDELGFAVDIWTFWDKDLEALAATGARFSSMQGYIHGDLWSPEGAKEVVRTAKEAIEASKILGAERLNVHSGELDDGNAVNFQDTSTPATPQMVQSVKDGLSQLGELGAAAGVTFTLENLNHKVDHPGVPLNRAEDTLAIVSELGHPNVKMMLDLYHAQVDEGNLVELVRRADGWIGEVQVADVPGRHEPGTGEVYYPAIARALREIGYTGMVGLEGWASGDSAAALEAFRTAFA